MLSFFKSVLNKLRMIRIKRLEEVLNKRALENGGSIELDFSDSADYNFYCLWLKTIGASKQKHPNVMKLIKQMRQENKQSRNLLKIQGQSDVGVVGPVDSTYIDVPNLLQSSNLNGLKTSLMASNDVPIVMANSVGEYCDKQSSVVITSSITDVKSNKSISKTFFFENENKVKATVSANAEHAFDGNLRTYKIASLFSSIQQAEDEKPKLTVKYSATSLIGLGKPIINDFHLIAPVPHDVTAERVKVSYNRDVQLPGYDYSYDNSPIENPDGKKYIRFILDVAISVTVLDGFIINGLQAGYDPILTLDHPVKGKVKYYYYANTNAPKMTLSNQNKTAVIALYKEEGKGKGADWCSILPFDDLENTVCETLNTYGQFTLSVREAKSGMDFSLPVSFRSVGGDVPFDIQNIQSKAVYMQWGCIGKGTLLYVDSAKKKTVKIADIKIGDFILDANSTLQKVTNIITGYEKTVLAITTESGKNILLTGSHSIKTIDGWIMAKEVNEDTSLVLEDSFDRVVQIQEIGYNDIVYNLMFESETELLGNGFVIGDYALQQRIKAKKKKEKEVVWSQESMKINEEIKSLLNIN